MSEKKDLREDELINEILSSYQDEELPGYLREHTIRRALNSGHSAIIRTITPAWKRLSLAASIAAFAIGIMMSNQLFASNQSSESNYWTFGETGLYSYVVEGE
ncbi:MAG: hypothetical protein K9N06_00225 [Candidatus Cloacimonetes bacterium]|nr:hypothetical protein [Candidatus Cloacimonadota bacterium]